MISDEDLAHSIFNSTANVMRELIKSGVVTTTVEATAVADSEDGHVLVDMGGCTVTGEGPEEPSADTDEDVASSDAAVASDENMSPCLNVASSDGEYWSQVSEGLAITPVEDGWARVSYDNTEGAAAVTLDAWQNPLGSIEEGETYTLLVEIRPVLPEDEGSEDEDTPESHDPDEIPDDLEDGYGADDAEPEEGDNTEGDTTAEVTSSIVPTTATSQLGASDPYRMVAGETRLTLTGQVGDTLLGTQFVVDAGKAMEADVRMSLYFGEYEGEYVPYGLLEGGAWQLVPTSSAVKAGDKVLVSLVGGSMVDGRVVGSGDRVSAAAQQAVTLAQQAEQIASAIGQFAWNDSAGTHVSTEDGVAEGTRNILLNSYGILLRAAANYLAALTQSGIAFYDGTGNAAANILASFGSSGAQIGNIDETLGHSTDQYKLLLDSSGLHIVFQGTQDVVVYDEPTEITSLGVGILDLLSLHLESYHGGSSSNYSIIRSGNKELYISTGSGYADKGIYIGEYDPTKPKHPVTAYGNTGVNGDLAVGGEATFTGRVHELADLPVLWSGAWYMNASQTATLSEPISAQAHGVILVWSFYADGQAQNYNFNYTTIPKWHVLTNSGAGIDCVLSSNTAKGHKYLYVYDGSIKGYANNGSTQTFAGVTHSNASFVLRAVLGF